jgi:hypothetical protein
VDGGFGEEAATLQFFLLLQPLATVQSHDRSVIGEESDHVGAAFDFLVQPLKLVGAPDLAPALLREVQEHWPQKNQNDAPAAYLCLSPASAICQKRTLFYLHIKDPPIPQTWPHLRNSKK